jgi:hypothetical protein
MKRMSRKLILSLACWLLALSPALAQSRTIPHPNENLKDFEARMDAYFAPQIKERGLAAMVKDESSEYNQYAIFMRRWKPRLANPTLHGDFSAYFQLESTFYRSHRSPAAGSPPAAGLHRLGETVAQTGLLTAGGAGDWQEIGPIAKQATHVGAEGTGPIHFVTFYDPSPSHLLSGSVSGGLFYSTNSGVSWSKTGTDTEIGRSGVGTAVFHPGHYQTWFAASAGNSSGGDPFWIGQTGGIFRTTDEGATWTQVGDPGQLGGIWTQVFKLAINPVNPSQLWAATSNGLFVTANALVASPAWAPVPALAGKYVYDFEIRPGDPNWLYATVADWSSGNLVNWGFMYSSDNGLNWQNVPGQPASTSGALALAIEVSPAKADNLYCLTIPPGFSPSELYIYDFGANTWQLVYGAATISVGAGHSFGVDRVNPGKIFLNETTEGRRYDFAGTSPAPFITYNSTYSGGTYHPDIECLVPHPLNAHEWWMCHHGGLSFSTDDGVSWADRSTGLGVAMVTRMATAASDPGYVALGTYHDGTSLTMGSWYPLWSPGWRQLPGSFCDGMRPMIDPTTPQYIWHSCQWGAWNFSSDFGVTFNGNVPSSPSWIVEAAFDRLAPQTQYRLATDSGGFHTVMRTSDRGVTWNQIADFQALFYPAANFEYFLWKVFTPETNGDYLLVHLLEKPRGSSAWPNNHLYRTKIANASAASVIASWQELPLPDNRWFSHVVFDPVDPDVVYIANSSSSAFTTNPTGAGMVFKVDYTNPAAQTYNACTPGVCWDLTQNLPNATSGSDALAVERGSNGRLYFASDFGVYESDNATRALGGSGWTQLGTGLPNTGYNGVEINYVNGMVRAGSEGRGAWEHELLTGCVQPPAAPALWLPLDEAAGPTALNAAGGNPGTHVGGPTPTAAGKVAGALCFDGQNDHVDVPIYGAISLGTSSFSLDAWVQRGPGATGTDVLIDKRSDAGGLLRGYSLFLSIGKLGLQLADGTFANFLSSATVPIDGRWHHVAVTVDRGNPAGGRFYIDGQPVGAPFNPSGHPGSLNSPAPFRIGARSALGSTGLVSAVLHGCLDEVEAFRRVLNADEVLALYRAGANGKCKLSCGLPPLTAFCGATAAASVGAQICNGRPAPLTFIYSFQPLPAQSGCAIAGPVAFTPSSGTLSVPAGHCATVPTAIGRPAMLTADGTTACYQMQVAVPSTQESFTCGATVEALASCNSTQINSTQARRAGGAMD